MGFLRELFDTLDSTGGTITILVSLYLLSVVLYFGGFPDWKELAGPILGALLAKLQGLKSNRERMNGHETKEKVDDRLNNLEKKVNLI